MKFKIFYVIKVMCEWREAFVCKGLRINTGKKTEYIE